MLQHSLTISSDQDLYKLGYRRMPEEMYMQWLGILNKEPEKYADQKIKVTK